jgi:hypothetical protein
MLAGGWAVRRAPHREPKHRFFIEIGRHRDHRLVQSVETRRRQAGIDTGLPRHGLNVRYSIDRHGCDP